MICRNMNALDEGLELVVSEIDETVNEVVDLYGSEVACFLEVCKQVVAQKVYRWKLENC